MKKYALLAISLIASPAFADEAKQSGFRLEARVGYETPTVNADSVNNGTLYKLGNSASIGAEAGYDVKLGRSVVAGVFANYDYAHAQTCYAGSCIGSDGNVAFGGRVGIILGNGQLYAKAGYDSFKLQASVNGVSASQNLNGAMGALGYQFNIGFEGSYADLGQYNGVNFQRRHAALTGGVRF